MNKTTKNLLLLIAAMVMGVFVTSCNNADSGPAALNETEELQDGLQQMGTRNIGVKTPKLTVYIETNDINPLNAKEYYFCNSNPREEVIDHVILFASNIRGNCDTIGIHHNPNQTYILNNRSTLIVPLQQKEIKVLLGLLGDWTGVGFANLDTARINTFAQKVANCVNAYGLDGVDFDDEYADYPSAPTGCSSPYPSPSSYNYGLLIQKVKELLPDKLVTAFRYNYATGFNQATLDSLDYMWPNFGCNPTPPTGLGNSKWAKLSVHIISSSQTNPNCSSIDYCTYPYGNYGAIMMFNLRQWDASDIMNCFAPNVWNGRTVCHTGTVHYKNYP